MRHFRALPVALLTFIIGIAISPTRFEVEGWGCGRMKDGDGGFSSTVYSAPDGTKLYFFHGSYASPEKTNAVFNRDLAEAVKVIHVTPKLDKHGNTIGRRAVAMLFDKEANEVYACVFWTQGTFMHSIHSKSLDHVLTFEKQHVS